MSILTSQFILPGNHKFVFYICDSYFCFVDKFICALLNIFFFLNYGSIIHLQEAFKIQNKVTYSSTTHYNYSKKIIN